MTELCHTCELSHVTSMDVSCYICVVFRHPPLPYPPFSAARALSRFLPHTLFCTPFPLPSMATNHSNRQSLSFICVCVCVFVCVCVSRCVRVYMRVRVRVRERLRVIGH